MELYSRKDILFTGIIFLFLPGCVNTETCNFGSVHYLSCPGLFDDYDEYYCCGSGSSQYCCDYDEKYPSTGLAAGIIAGIIVAVIIVVIIIVTVVICCCIVRSRTGNVLGTRAVTNQTVVTTGNPYIANHSGVAGYTGPVATAGVPATGNVNAGYPIGNVNPPPVGSQNYVTGYPQPNHANPVGNQAKVPPSTYPYAPPSYEHVTHVQSDQMMTAPTAPSTMPSGDTSYTGQVSTNDGGGYSYGGHSSGHDYGGGSSGGGCDSGGGGGGDSGGGDCGGGGGAD